MVRASPKKVPTPHPTYNEMVRNALATCRGFQKMSRQAVAAFIKSNYGVDNRTALNKSLKALVETGIVSQAKASYKLAAGQRPVATSPSKPTKAPSKPAKAPPKKAAPAAKKKATTKASASSKKTSPKKPSAKGKKAPPIKKTVAKKASGRKSPAAKKAPAKKGGGRGGGRSGRS